MAQINISNTLWNDTSGGVLVYAKQVQDNEADYSKYSRITSEMINRFHLNTKFQTRLNDFFLNLYDEFCTGMDKVFGNYPGTTTVLGYNETAPFIVNNEGSSFVVYQVSGPGMTKPVLLHKGDTFYMEHDKAMLFTLTSGNTELHQYDRVNKVADNIGGSTQYTAIEDCWITASCGLIEDEEYFDIEGGTDSYNIKKPLYVALPNDVSRSQTDATFVHNENGTITNLFYLRQATSSMAGLMTAADKTKLNNLPTSDFILVGGQMTQLGADFFNGVGTTLFSIPFADSTGGGLISFNDFSRFIELGTKQELDAQFAQKVDKITGKGLSTEDYTTAEKGKLAALPTKAELDETLATKANKDGYYPRMIVGGAESLIGDVPQTATYTFRRTGGSAIGEPVARLAEIQGNTGVVNQLASGFVNRVAILGITITADNTNNCITISGTATATNNLYFKTDLKVVANHKYVLKGMTGAVGWLGVSAGSTYSDRGSGVIFASDIDRTSALLVFGFDDGDVFNNLTVYPKLFDLTLMYGQGNEPGTVAEFEQRMWRDYGKTLDEYIAYTQGKLINCKAVALESAGQNQWDEEWEEGNISITTGAKIVELGRIRSKNLIPVLPNTDYFIFSPNYSEGANRICFYASDGSFISGNSSLFFGRVFTTPVGCCYIMFSPRTYGASYKHDICINISDAALNGTYRPYWKEVTNLNLTTLTGINPTTGVRETIFPNGMRSKGDVRDVISGNTATVKIGDPTQEAPLENTVLATPIVYTDIQFADGTPFVLPRNYEVQNGGTEKITHAEGEDSIAPVMSAIYGLNAVGFVQDAPKDYTSQATLDGLVSLLSSLTGHSITKTWDASQNKWTFSAQ